MRLPFAARPPQKPAVIRTEGEFPHARRASVRIACGCSSSCCMFLLGTGVGGLVGGLYGLVQGWNTASGGNMSAGWCLFHSVRCALGYSILFSLAGLAIGGVLDMMLSSL